jgi:oxygen-independent coproporphyrinogen-3 oxidase
VPSSDRPEHHGDVSDAGALGLYVHVPFCAAICSYCNFNRGLLDEDLKRHYVDALTKEIRRLGDGSRVDSIFFGGGTPSLLAVEEVARILDACRGAFDVASGAETTLEMNPESCSTGYVSALLEAGINRISLGVQSFDDGELARLGRVHTADRARAALTAIREAGCGNVSLDLMLWLPAQSRARCAASVAGLVALSPDHASLYMLELYPNAPLQEEAARRGWSQAPDEDAAAMYLDALAMTDAAGYEQYEISNVARPGRRSRHNLKYWLDGEWQGFGCGAHSTRAGVRWKNVSETARYVDAVERGVPVAETLRLSAEERLGDALFTGLRLAEGICPAAVERRYGVDVEARYGTDVRRYVDAGWMIDAGGRWRLTRAGMLVSNEVLSTFV